MNSSYNIALSPLNTTSTITTLTVPLTDYLSLPLCLLTV